MEGCLFPILSLVGRVEDVARFPAQFEIFHGRQNTAVVAHVEEVQVSERLLPGEAGIVADVHSVMTLQINFTIRYRKLLNFYFGHALRAQLSSGNITSEVLCKAIAPTLSTNQFHTQTHLY